MNPPTETAKDPHELIENAAKSFAGQIAAERQALGISPETPLFQGAGNTEVAIYLAFARQVPADMAERLEGQHYDEPDLERDRIERAAAARDASRQALVLYFQHAAVRGAGFAEEGRGCMDDVRRIGKSANIGVVVERTRQEFAKAATKR